MIARTLDEVEVNLNRVAQKVGHVYGVEVGVARLYKTPENKDEDAELLFTDADGRPIIDDEADGVLCCTAQEIGDGTFLKLFAARALYAALALRFLQAEANVR